ncbi:hypothetical protein [Actinomadura madurae]|uniref:hypothetical protein n=1 Tax=Actinomadura madurae TaxID=1993 RepID=UPI0027E2FEB8|nr:hypothetical protein [Actinomadura madurae]
MQWSRTARSGVPSGASTTWVPPMVSSVVPGSSSVPAEAYRSGPSETSTASCANVSVLDSSVGNPSTPESEARTLTPGGIGVSPLIARTTAPLSPEMNRSVSRTTRAASAAR